MNADDKRAAGAPPVSLVERQAATVDDEVATGNQRVFLGVRHRLIAVACVLYSVFHLFRDERSYPLETGWAVRPQLCRRGRVARCMPCFEETWTYTRRDSGFGPVAPFRRAAFPRAAASLALLAAALAVGE